MLARFSGCNRRYAVMLQCMLLFFCDKEFLLGKDANKVGKLLNLHGYGVYLSFSDSVSPVGM